MASEFNPLLEELGVNVELHESLLAQSNRLHEKMFLWQKNRPETMAWFDDALHAAHGARVREIHDYRKGGGKSIGTFCIYVPDEIALAADVLPIPLCGGSSFPLHYADKMFPTDICPLVRSTFGMSFSGTCPYKTLKDWALGETTCDAKKKAWDLVGFKALEVPQRKAREDRDLWRSETRRFMGMVEDLSGVKVAEDRLRETVRLVNDKRRALQRINDTRKADAPPISGLDALLVSQIALNQDTAAFNKAANALADELEDRLEKGVSAYDRPGPRVLMAGTPSPMGNAKVHYVAECAGLRVVADESCTGQRYFSELVDETAQGFDGLVDAVADRYFAIDCACFSPNKERMENVAAIASDYRIEGVVHNVLQYCHGFNVEAKAVENTLARKGIPSLKFVTDYAEEDMGQLNTRAQAFFEMLCHGEACSVSAPREKG